MSFTTTGIDTSLPSNAAYLKTSSSATTSLAVSIVLRNWITGESFSTNGACVEWKGPNYYSLSTQSSPGNCKSWQTNWMYWYGGSNVGPKPGYWRSANTSDNFIACLFSPACLGYVSPSNNNLGECFTGYQGILWADCVPGFSRTSGFEWGLCPNQVWNVIRLLLVFIAVIIGIAILIKSTLSGALQKKNVQAVYMKLLMNHIQLLFLASTFQLKWPSRVEDIFSTSAPVAQVSQQNTFIWLIYWSKEKWRQKCNRYILRQNDYVCITSNRNGYWLLLRMDNNILIHKEVRLWKEKRKNNCLYNYHVFPRASKHCPVHVLQFRVSLN